MLAGATWRPMARLPPGFSSPGATVLQATPATWRLLLEAGWPGSPAWLLCGGEALPRELADDWSARGRALEYVRADRDDHLVLGLQVEAGDMAGFDRRADREHALCLLDTPLRGRYRSG